MGTSKASRNQADEDFIDMEMSSSSNFLCYSISSPPQNREFEFQMCAISHDKECTISPADELFYKGKLLPLHLPPRLQMVEKLLKNSNDTTSDDKPELPFEENFAIPSISSSFTPSTNTSTTLKPCNISPSGTEESYCFECSTEMSDFICDNSKKIWTKKLNKINKCSLRQKLKASSAYIKSLFTKSDCSDESSANAARNVEPEIVSRGKDCLNKYMKLKKKNPFGKIDDESYKIVSTSNHTKSFDHKEIFEDGIGANSHRRSFSGAIQSQCATKTCLSSSITSSGSSSSSSSFSFGSNGFFDSQLLKRSISSISDIERSIEGAIAHCKQSQQPYSSRKIGSEANVCSLSASKIAACGDQERPGLCII
ncbi:hypothetical protein CFOL_v3_08494 [Cephalotus follicularis]|uniref:Membrane-associated kinase regulator 4 n=1 Tax=Cephalotus follicularis TaxID=3775 RepID=A0A1Q3BAP7_CEPFO|nr:hypothetical protein CFOL_v3_08494 [Cephalotus follicularis]